MNKEFFIFCHLLYQHDSSLIKADSDAAFQICNAAIIQFADEHLTTEGTTFEKWIFERYDDWPKNYVYVSDSMPESAKRIIVST